MEKRRAEFTAGRIAAKLAVARLLGVRPTRDDIRLTVDAGECAGRPSARYVPRDERVEVSISHVDGTAMAAASRTRLGMDLVTSEAHAGSFEREAFAPGELDTWRVALGSGWIRAAVSAVGFAAKEAALKWRGSGLRDGLQSSRVTPLAISAAESVTDLDALGRRLVVSFALRDTESTMSTQWRETELHGWLIPLGRLVLVILDDQAPCNVKSARSGVRVQRQ